MLNESSTRPADGGAATDPPLRPVPEAGKRGGASAISVLRGPVAVRGTLLFMLTVLAAVYTLWWARAVFIPLVLGLMLTYALSPVVDRLQRWRVPRALGAALLLIGILGGGWSMLYSFSDDAATLIESLPEAARKLRRSLHDPQQTPPTIFDHVQKAGIELQRAAEEDSATALRNSPGVTRVVVERPPFNVRDYLWTGTLGLVAVIGQTAIVILLTYFMLVSGDTFRRKLVKLAGPRLSHKRITVEALDEITAVVRSYLLVQLLLSVIVGAATWLLFAWIGLEQAAVWGVVAGITNLVPYLGAVVVGAGSMLSGFMQFGTFHMVALIGSVTLLVHLIVGQVLMPWMTSRAARMSPVTVFVGLLVWGWLWGVWGLLLGVPVLVAVKAWCDRSEDLKPIGEILGT